MSDGPPGLSRRLVEWAAPPGAARDGLVGDLDELYADRLETEGRRAADRWYRRQAFGAAARYLLDRSGRRMRSEGGPGKRGEVGWMGTVLLDLRYALRSLRRSPGFAAAAVLTLALGIGGTTATFTVVDTVLLRPPLWVSPDRLVNVWTTYPHWRGQESLDAFWDRIGLSFPEYEDWAADVTLFSGTAAYTARQMTLAEESGSERVMVGVATASLTGVLGVEPVRGRWFRRGEDVTRERVAVLSDGFWRRRFGSDPSVLGESLVLDDERFVVIGVLPAGFALRNVFAGGGTGEHDVWLPIAWGGDITRRGDRSFDAIGRLADGATVEAALEESEPILRGDLPPERRGARMQTRADVEVGRMRAPLVLLLAASGVLLLIACGNVATMLLGESLSRRSEIATRAALGAGRRRIVRQLLTESVVLGFVSAAVGAVAAGVITRGIVSLGPQLPVAREVALSPRALLVASGLGVVTGIVFGLAPATVVRRSDLATAMRRGGRGARRRDRRLQEVVIVLEVALTMVLLVSGGLLTRTVLNLSTVDPGFSTLGLAVVGVTGSGQRFTAERLEASYADALANARSLPGVTDVGGVNTLPLFGPPSSTSLEIEGAAPPTGNDPGPEAQRRIVFPGYHQAMQIPLVEGRLLESADGPSSRLVVVVSRRFAEVYWPGESAIGRRIRHDRRWWSVVGVVGDVRHASLAEEPVATYYVPYAQAPMRGMTLVARVDRDPSALLTALRDAVWSADPDVAITGVHTMSGLAADAAEAERYRALLTTVFAVMAAILAAVGVFGVTARALARRRAEMGVRLAMGAGGRRAHGPDDVRECHDGPRRARPRSGGVGAREPAARCIPVRGRAC